LDDSPADRLNQVRQASFQSVRDALLARDFTEEGGRSFTGHLTIGGGTYPITVEIPEAFPDALPAVFVSRGDLPRRIPHHEANGKVCIAPSTGTLLDSKRPVALLDWALNAAADVLQKGLEGQLDTDFQEEYLAYWDPVDRPASYYSLCDPARDSGPVEVHHLPKFGSDENGSYLFSDSPEDAASWTEAVSAPATRTGDAFYLVLSEALDPPEFGEVLLQQEFLQGLKASSSDQDWDLLERWLDRTGQPSIILIRQPDLDDGSGALVAVELDRIPHRIRKKAQRGFRPGRVPPLVARSYAGAIPVTRLRVKRVDLPYLAARGGASTLLAASWVILAGVGAVGSHLAALLASAGVGRLTLVDPETLTHDNVYRHALGMGVVGYAKVRVMAHRLKSQFPHLRVEASTKRLEDLVLEGDPAVVESDVMVLATGDETLERRINQLLQRSKPIVHAWVEPLGIAGHALASVGGSGCLECLYRCGLSNKASITAPGQDLTKSLAGCAGVFTPFSQLDAQRSAVEATYLTTAILTHDLNESLLITWRGDRSDPEELGIRLSRRDGVVPLGARVKVYKDEFSDPGCPTCASPEGSQ
jgi:hypothetical protein